MAQDLFNAINQNDLFYLQEVLSNNPELDVDDPLISRNVTGLHIAAEKGYSSCVAVLIAAGASVNVVDLSGYTPLMNAISTGYPLVVRGLLRAGCDCNAKTTSNLTALHMACKLGSREMVATLIKCGARVDTWSQWKDTALTMAIKDRSFDIVCVLLYGARYVDPNQLARCSLTFAEPLYHCLVRDRFSLAETLWFAGYRSQKEFKKYLCSERHRDSEGATVPFHGSDLRTKERQSLDRLLADVFTPHSLLHLCRLNIRSLLDFDIHIKLPQLRIPGAVESYLSFSDVYTCPDLTWDHDVIAICSSNTQL